MAWKDHKKNKSAKLSVGFLSGILFSYIGATVIAPEYGTIGIVWTVFAFVLCILYGYFLIRHAIRLFLHMEAPNTEKTSADIRYEKQKELYHLCRDYDKKLISKTEFEELKTKLLDEIK